MINSIIFTLSSKTITKPYLQSLQLLFNEPTSNAANPKTQIVRDKSLRYILLFFRH